MVESTRQAGTRSLTPKKTDDSALVPSPWRRAKIGAALLGFVLGLGVLLTLSGGGSDRQSSSDEPDTVPTARSGGSGSGAKAKSVENGVPVGYPHTKAGAVAAGINYQMARSAPGYFTDSELRRRVLKTAMTREALGEQLNRDDQATLAIRRFLEAKSMTASQMVMRSAPVGTKVTAYSTTTATVDIWMSEIVGVPREDSPMPVSGTWSTYTLILQWQDGDWKVATISQSDGPTPLVAADSATSSTSDLRSANEEFDAPPYGG